MVNTTQNMQETQASMSQQKRMHLFEVKIQASKGSANVGVFEVRLRMERE